MARTLKTEKVAEVWGLGIIRFEEKKIAADGEVYGKSIWYDVCLDDGNGRTLKSFKTKKAAEKFARDW